jgi:hypothetical protein
MPSAFSRSSCSPWPSSRVISGGWRWIYVGGAVIALYLNVFVGIVQAFEKVPALKALAPTQSEPPFKMTQLVVLAFFVCSASSLPSGFGPRRSVLRERCSQTSVRHCA